jgi:DNA replication protein DnaC
MQSTGEIIKSLIKERVLEVMTCDRCGEEYNISEFYFNGEKKYTLDFCRKCFKQKQDEQLKEEVQEGYKKHLKNKYNWLTIIPPETQYASFDNYEPKNETQKSALEISKKFAENNTQNTTLFFQGDTGLGKTHLAYSIHESFFDHLHSSIFIDLPSLLSEIRNTFNNPNKSQGKIMDAISETDLLVLDDVGAEYVKPDANGYESWAADILFQIVNSRQGKKTIYTTNFTSKHLTKKYGMMSKRIISRMMANAKVIKVEGDDHRLKGLD